MRLAPALTQMSWKGPWLAAGWLIPSSSNVDLNHARPSGPPLGPSRCQATWRGRELDRRCFRRKGTCTGWSKRAMDSAAAWTSKNGRQNLARLGLRADSAAHFPRNVEHPLLGHATAQRAHFAPGGPHIRMFRALKDGARLRLLVVIELAPT